MRKVQVFWSLPEPPIAPGVEFSRRLVTEARRAARGFQFGLMGSTWAAGSRTAVIVNEGWTSERGTVLILGLVGIPLTYLMWRRWHARGEWLRTTPQWWERLDEAPDVIPFPRLVAWTERQEARVKAGFRKRGGK